MGEKEELDQKPAALIGNGEFPVGGSESWQAGRFLFRLHLEFDLQILTSITVLDGMSNDCFAPLLLADRFK